MASGCIEKLDTDVFVAGGGPAGLAAAIAARRAGLRVVLADSLRPPVDKACGEGLMPQGLRSAERLGLALPPDCGYPFRGVRFLDGGRAVSGDFPQGHGLGIRRTVLHLRMTRAAEDAGVELRWGEPVLGLEGQRVRLGSGELTARWIVGADGAQSRVRRWAGLEQFRRDFRRFGARQHFRVRPWSPWVDVYWGPGWQVYLTPVGPEELGVALLARDSRLKLSQALTAFPEVQERLAGCEPVSSVRGALAASRRLRRVTAGRVALIGDASAMVDPITGEGLSLAFRQAVALAEAMARGRLSGYERAHATILRAASIQSRLLLLLDRRPGLRQRVLGMLAARPGLLPALLEATDRLSA